MNLSEVNLGIRRRRRPKRLGRGPGSGQGKTAGRGHKGQGQLSGWTQHPAFEGGQFPLVRRVPKRGFNNKRFALKIGAINVGLVEKEFAAGEEVSLESLRQKRLLVGRFDALKILGDGTLTKKLKFSAHQYSASARQKIEQSGGQIVELPGPAPVAKNVGRAKNGGRKPAPPGKRSSKP